MCRWGCTTHNTTYMCKWCGTRYCKDCLRGDFTGHMTEATKCRQCNQPRCQGQRVEYVPLKNPPADDGKSGKRGRSASSKRGKSATSRSKPNSAKKTGKKKKR